MAVYPQALGRIALLIGFVAISTNLHAQCPPSAISIWTLDELGAGTYAESVAGNDATCDGECPVATAGLIGGAQAFAGTGGLSADGTTGTYDFAVGESFTLEAWFRTTADDAVGTLLGRVDGASNLGLFLGTIPGGQVGFSLVSVGGEGVSAFVSSGVSVADGNWHHVAAVRDADENENRLYVDGVLVDVEPIEYTTGFESATASWGIGVTPGTKNSSPYTGDLDEVAVHMGALDSAVIAQHSSLGVTGIGLCDPFAPSFTNLPPLTAAATELYRYQPKATGNPAPSFGLVEGPVGLAVDSVTGDVTWVPTLLDVGDHVVVLEVVNPEGSSQQGFTLTVEVDVFDCPTGLLVRVPLDATQGGLYRDRAGDADLTCVDDVCPIPVPGAIAGAQNFSGPGLGLMAEAQPILDFAPGESFTFECWFRMDQPGTEIFMGRIDLDNGLEVWLGQFQGKVAFLLKDTSGADGEFLVSEPAMTDGLWHHAVGVRDVASNQMKVYVDGVLSAQRSEGFVGDFASSEAPLTVGWLGSGDGFPFRGELDEIALYDRALSDEEVTDHFLRGSAGQPVCDPACPQIVGSSPPQEVCTGETVALTVETLGTTPLAIQWSKDGSPIPEATTPILDLGVVTSDQAGQYSVTIGNDCGETSTEVAVAVASSPMILVGPADVAGCEGDAVELTVEAEGEGLSYEWRKGGVAVRGATGSTLSLTISEKTLGSYDVLVSSACGSVVSAPAAVAIDPACAGEFRRGDVNGDGRLDVADVVTVLGLVALRSLPSACADAADFDDDGEVDQADGVALAMHYFLGGPPPVAPYPACGVDPSTDTLGCKSPPCP
ncbi:MAG: LamG-like jellyroll fold domain-containing protein [Planctomycetota bacterium]